MRTRFFSNQVVRAGLAVSWCVLSVALAVDAQTKRRAPASGRVAVVVDERLAVLRDEPRLTGRVVQRLGRGRAVSIVGGAGRGDADGVSFYRVAVTRRTRGWLQAESIVSGAGAGDDERLLRLIRGSKEFDRIARARIFLDTFPRSPLRPAALLLFGEAAEEAARKLSAEAGRRLDASEMTAGGAPTHTYFLNYSGLDRWRKQGIVFVFDSGTKQFRYDGAAWREILRRHPRSPEAVKVRQRLESSPVIGTKVN